MGNTPSTNASSTTAMTPEVGAGTSVLASTDDGDESICSGSNGGKPKLQQPFIPLEPGNPSGNAVFPANAHVAMTYSGHYTYQHPTHAPRDITYPSKLRSSTTTADYYYPPSSFATTLSSSVSSVSSNSSTSSSLSSYSQGSPSPPHTHVKRSSRSAQGLHDTSNLPLQSNSPTNSSSSTTSSGTVTPLRHSPLVSGSDPKKSPGTNKLHQQALLSSTSTLPSKPANIAPVHSPSSMTLNSSGRRNESKSNSSSASKNHPHIQQQPAPSLKKADPPKKQHAVDINELIQRLLDAGVSSYSSKASRNLCITNNEIIGICRAARPIFLAQPTLLELGTPVQVVGDIHGQYGDLMRVFQTCGMPPHSNYLFLGDYVDRGKQSIETILLLLCFKIRYPENVFLLRGNHECASVTKVYGFYDECKRRASVKVWKSFVDTFNTFPIAATIGGKIFCVHGGLSPYLNSLDDIRNIHRPTDIPDVGLLSDLLWSDPDASVAEWSPNDRGISYCFGSSVVDAFCSRFNFDLIARGHMVVEDGYEFFDRRKLVTVFSAPNYCGEFGNWAAVMSVGKDLLCRFELLKPLDINGVRKALKENKFVGSINSTRATNLRHKG